MAEKHIHDLFEEGARRGEAGYAIAFALLELASAQERTATALKNLGLADASTPFGAIEALGMQIKETGELIAEALSNRDD